VKAWRVDHTSEFESVFKAALATNGPTLIDVRTDPFALVPIPWQKP
jgi:acetolactate synthase-1/2/3 large subunit